MIIAKFSRKINPLHRSKRHDRNSPDGRLPGISLEDVSQVAPTPPPKDHRYSRKSMDEDGSERRRLRHLSPFRSSEKRASGEFLRQAEKPKTKTAGDRRPGSEVASPSPPPHIQANPNPNNRASMDCNRPEVPERGPPKPSRPATDDSAVSSSSYCTASTTFGAGHSQGASSFLSPSSPKRGSPKLAHQKSPMGSPKMGHMDVVPNLGHPGQQAPSPGQLPSPGSAGVKTTVKSPLIRPDSPNQPVPDLTDFNRSFHMQNPGKVTCGFEDIFLPVDVEKQEHHRLEHLQFRHEDSLRLHHTLQKQLYNKPGDVVLEFYDVTVYKEDIDNLQPGYWLNDNNISFVYEYLERLEIMRAGFQSQIFLLRPSMAFLLGQGDPREVAEFLPDFKHASFIFLPINDNNNVEIVSGNHWSLLVVSVEDGKAIYYDTVGECNIAAARNVADKLGVVLNQKLNFLVAPTPQQSNGSDCGVYVCEITSLLLRRLLYTEGFIDLGISNLTFVADAGRTFILTAILQLISMFGPKIREAH
ncbi:NEDD8-specific protease 2 [Yarrowia sp. C11]|nr:NEDD8-specific protease 2 [Yarrowia sp. E02]KAG5373179.1 NEDD8-specific protease 2 [Yarrowia sp. C11]